MIHFKEVEHGFEYGAAKVTRWFSDKKQGWVTIGLETKKYPRGIQIYVTKTGKVRFFYENKEFKLTVREVK